jgi:hypothetical protein
VSAWLYCYLALETVAEQLWQWQSMQCSSSYLDVNGQQMFALASLMAMLAGHLMSNSKQ